MQGRFRSDRSCFQGEVQSYELMAPISFCLFPVLPLYSVFTQTVTVTLQRTQTNQEFRKIVSHTYIHTYVYVLIRCSRLVRLPLICLIAYGSMQTTINLSHVKKINLNVQNDIFQS